MYFCLCVGLCAWLFFCHVVTGFVLVVCGGCVPVAVGFRGLLCLFFSVRDDWVSWIDIRTFVNKLFCCLQFSALFVLVGWGSDFLLFCNFFGTTTR